MKLFHKLLEENLEETYNLTLMRGLSYEHLKPEKVLQHIDAMWADWKSRFPEEVVYLGTTLATPKEHAANRCISGNDLRIPLDESDIYTIKISFGYKPNYPNAPIKKLAPRFIQLWYLREGGHCKLDGSDYYFSPLFISKGFHVVNNTTLLCWINKLNLKFEKVTNQIKVNNLLQAGNLFTCKLHQIPDKIYTQKQRKDERKINVKIHPPIMLYLMVKFGLTETLKKYFDVDVIASDKVYEELVQEYPTSEYIIVSSSGIPPKGKPYYVRPVVKLVIPKDKWTHQLSHALSGIYFAIDFFGDEMRADTVDDLEIWKYILGDIVLNSPNGKLYLIEQMDNHLKDSIDILFDKITETEFRLDGFEFTNIEDVFVHVVKDGLSILNSRLPHSMEGNRLTVLRYALRSLNGAINRIGYEFAKERSNNNHITEKKLVTTLRSLKTNLLISGDRSVRKLNGEVNTAQSSSDNMYFKITSMMVPQDKNDRETNNKNGGKGVIDKVSNRAHASVMKYGRAFSQPSRAPTGREEYNPAVKLTSTGEMYIDEYSQSLVDEAQKILDLKDNGGQYALGVSGEDEEFDINDIIADDMADEMEEDEVPDSIEE